MNRFRMTADNFSDNVCSESTYVIDHIIPLCIKEINDNNFSVLFLVQSDANDEDEHRNYIVMYFSYTSDTDKEFVKKYPLNINNITKNEKQLSMYIEMTKDLDNSKIFSSDFNMEEYHKKIFYYCYCYREEEHGVSKMTLLMRRNLFVQLNLFFVMFMNYDIMAGSIFFDLKLSNVEYVTPTSIKLDGSTKSDIGSKYVLNHYTIKAGYNEYKINFISPAMLGRKFINPMGYEPYINLYGKDAMIDQMFMDPNTNTLFVLYYEYSELDKKFKRTIAFKLSETLFNHTNFIDPYKIYERIN